MFEIDFREILTVGMVLFALIDIVGSITIIVDLRTKHGHIESEKASLVAGVIMIVFLFIGEEFLNIIGIDVHSFAVAGSFVLFFIALEMILRRVQFCFYRTNRFPINCRCRNDDYFTFITF